MGGDYQSLGCSSGRAFRFLQCHGHDVWPRDQLKFIRTLSIFYIEYTITAPGSSAG